MEFQKPTFLPLYNPSRFSTKQSLKSIRKQSFFPAGIKVPFIQFNDGSIQKTSAYNSEVAYVKQNTQLNEQPFNMMYIIQGNNVESIYLPKTSPKNGYELELWNSQNVPFILVSDPHKIYNSFYCPTGDSSINIFPNKLVKLRFFENSWSLLIF
jgi:hypothetical protein